VSCCTRPATPVGPGVCDRIVKCSCMIVCWVEQVHRKQTDDAILDANLQLKGRAGSVKSLVVVSREQACPDAKLAVA
jgi:hypothetical protein